MKCKSWSYNSKKISRISDKVMWENEETKIHDKS